MAALHPSIAALQVAIVGVRFFGLSRGVFRYLERYVSHTVTFRLLTRLKVWFYDAVEPLSPAQMGGQRAGDLLYRAVGDIESLEAFFVRAVTPPLVALMTLVLLAGFLGGFHFQLILLSIGLFLVVGMGMPGIIGLLSRRWAREVVNLRASLQVDFVDSVGGLADLLAFNIEDRIGDRMNDHIGDLHAAEKKLAQIQALHRGLTVWGNQFGMWAVLLLGIVLVDKGELNALYLAALALMVLASFEALAPLPEAAREMNASVKAGERIFEFLGDDRNGVVPQPQMEVPVKFDIEITDLWMRYGEMDPYVLSSVDLEIPENGRVVIVGPSGAGKTSLLNCLLRFWEFERGSIRIGGIGIQEWDRGILRRQTGVVAQDSYTFNASVRENLLIARPEATQDELVDALYKAQLEPLIQTLPKGLDTPVGEHGLQLSAGERQRLAIARVFLRNSPLLLLDEVTANLDALTERSIMDALHRLMEGRTTLMLTHRLVDLEKMDEILVLRDGRVVERGTHAELISMHGAYYRSWSLQQQLLE
jgi:ATP-binding cassette subfamily C protein CydC